MQWRAMPQPVFRGGVSGVFGIGGLLPQLPVITVTGGQVALFSRDSVDYTEILFQQSGGFSLSAPVSGARWALAAGGANGGRQSNTSYLPGGGGAGGLIRSAASVDLGLGDYSVTVGAGAPAATTSGGEQNGSNSLFHTPTEAYNAIGGGKGASSGAGNTAGVAGGSGGGGRGGAAGQGSFSGLGTVGQGFSGGVGYSIDQAELRASGGGGGAGAPGVEGASGVAGPGGQGVPLDWIATPRTVCRGGAGVLASALGNTPNESWGSGGTGAVSGTAGAGGNGFMVLVVRTDAVEVVAA